MSTLFNLYYIIHTNNQKTKISPPKLKKQKTKPIIPNPLKKKLVSIWMKDESAVFFPKKKKRERERERRKEVF